MDARIFGAALTIVVASSQASALGQTVDREFPLSGATTLRINLSGHVHVIPDATISSVKIHLTDYGPSVPALAFKDSRAGNRLNVSITGPSQSVLPFVGASGYEVEVRVPTNVRIDLREFGGRVQVDAVTAPAQYYNANGNIEIADARSAVTAEADNGDINVTSAHGDVMLSTGNGKNSATLARDWHGKNVRMEASNGAMRLNVPADFHANFDITAANGKVSNPLRSSGKQPVVFMLSQSGDITVATTP